MNKRYPALLALFLAAVFLVALAPRTGIADLGDFSGDSDYGGSDYGGDYDYGGSDYDYGGGYSGSGRSSCDSEDVFVALMGFIVFIGPIIVISILMSIFNRRKQNMANNLGATRTAQSSLMPIGQYAALDPYFSPEALRAQLGNLYVKMQECCTNRDVGPIRAYFADALWQQFDRQMKDHIRLNRVNRVENIAVLNVDLKGFYEDKGEDVIVAEIVTRITDYTVDLAADRVISGNKNREKIMTYEYALSRPIDRRAKQSAGGAIVRVCPHCGAELSVNEAAVCPYCGSVLTFGDHDWTVYSIKGISQHTL